VGGGRPATAALEVDPVDVESGASAPGGQEAGGGGERGAGRIAFARGVEQGERGAAVLAHQLTRGAGQLGRDPGRAGLRLDPGQRDQHALARRLGARAGRAVRRRIDRRVDR
jgi:hypothetical protein